MIQRIGHEQPTTLQSGYKCRLHFLSVALAGGFALSCSTRNDDGIEGRLEISIADDFENGRSWEEYDLRLSDDRAIRLETDVSLGLRPDALVRVTGEWAGSKRLRGARVLPLDASSDDGIGTIYEPLLPATPPTPRRVAVILINFADLTTQPLTPDQVRDRVFGSATSTRAYFEEQFWGWVILQGRDNPQGDVLGWYTIPSPSSPCNDDEWGDQARAAAMADGKDVNGYDHIVFWWPRTSACSYGGKGATSGGTRAPTGTFNYGRNTWINSDTGGNVVSHEFGHNFRMSHSGTRNCTNGGTRVPMGASCTTDEYGSRFDVMGRGGHRHSNAYNKGRAGVIGPPNVITVRTSGTYSIQPIERGLACGAQAIRIPRSTNEFYYVDYRARTGFDAGYSASSSAVTGAVITVGPNYETNYGNTGQLDMTPTTTSFEDGALLVGQTFSDPDGLVNITLESRNDTSASLRVEFPGGATGTNQGAECAGAGGGGAGGGGGAPGGRGGSGGGGGGSGGSGGISAGSGGAPGGTGGSAGASGGSGGLAGSGVIGGDGGSAAGSAGASGTPNGGAAGIGPGGVTAAGTAGAAGLGNAGSAAAAGQGVAGSAATAGSGNVGTPPPTADELDGGCGCRVPGRGIEKPSHRGSILALLGLLFASALRRRRRA